MRIEESNVDNNLRELHNSSYYEKEKCSVFQSPDYLEQSNTTETSIA